MADTSGLAIGSLVLGILGFLLMWLPIVGLILSVIGLVMGIAALSRISDDSASGGRILAIVGIVFACVGLLVNILVTAGVIVLFSAVDNNMMMNWRT